MKTIMMYQCEKCRKIYDSAIQAMTCEAAHYGLTLEEYYHLAGNLLSCSPMIIADD